MDEVLKGNKIVGCLNPNDNWLLLELTSSIVPLRHILATLRNKNGRIANNIKHIYNTCQMHRQSITCSRSEMQHLMKSLVENKYVYHYMNVYFDGVRYIF